MALHRLGQPGLILDNAILTLLGGLSIDMFARRRASQLVGIDRPEVFYDPFVTIPTETTSLWNTQLNALGTITRPAGSIGGVARFATGTDANGSAIAAAAGTVSPAVGAFMGNPQTSQTYLLSVFALITAPVSTMALRIGMAVSGTAVTTMNMGVRGASSTTRYRFSSGTSGALSTVAIDTNFHVGEMWTTGDGNCHGSIDGETPVSYLLPTLGAGFPWLVIADTPAGTSRQVDIGSVVYIVPRS
jgi:multisubunit Na+/H+ antiporter MnhG subunit